MFGPTNFPRRRRGSNPGPLAQEASALTTRLPRFTILMLQILFDSILATILDWKNYDAPVTSNRRNDTNNPDDKQGKIYFFTVNFLGKMRFLRCLCIASFLCFVSANASEFILQSGASGHCGQAISVNNSVILKSHAGAGLLGGLASYTANQNCEISYNAGIGMFSKSEKNVRLNVKIKIFLKPFACL